MTTLAALADCWKMSGEMEIPDWTALRVVLDWLAWHRDEIAVCIASGPPESESAMMNALLAGVAEKLADDAGLERPAWTGQVPGLAREWCEFGTPRMLARWRAETPVQLMARGLVIDEDSLWRRRLWGVGE